MIGPTRRRRAILLTLAWLLAPTVTAEPLPTVMLQAGVWRIDAEVAATPESRETGLMHRTQMPAQHGMLFVFAQKDRYCFWMKNTLLPLSIAFLDDDGTIVAVDEMTPQTETVHCTPVAARFALEMNRNWFADHRLGTGSRITGLPR